MLHFNSDETLLKAVRAQDHIAYTWLYKKNTVKCDFYCPYCLEVVMPINLQKYAQEILERRGARPKVCENIAMNRIFIEDPNLSLGDYFRKKRKIDYFLLQETVKNLLNLIAVGTIPTIENASIAELKELTYVHDTKVGLLHPDFLNAVTDEVQKSLVERKPFLFGITLPLMFYSMTAIIFIAINPLAVVGAILAYLAIHAVITLSIYLPLIAAVHYFTIPTIEETLEDTLKNHPEIHPRIRSLMDAELSAQLELASQEIPKNNTSKETQSQKRVNLAKVTETPGFFSTPRTSSGQEKSESKTQVEQSLTETRTPR